MPLRSCDARTIAIAISFKDEQFGANQRRDTMQIAKISTFAIATALILAGIATWANSGHSSAQAAIATAQIDPFPLMANGETGSLRFADGVNPTRIDQPQRFGSASYSRLDAGQSTIRLDLPGLAVGVCSNWGWELDSFRADCSSARQRHPRLCGRAQHRSRSALRTSTHARRSGADRDPGKPCVLAAHAS